MNKVAKSAIISGRTLSFAADPDFHEFHLPYPILGVESCHYDAEVEKVGPYRHARFSIKAKLRLEDSRDAVPFVEERTVREEVDLLDDEDDTGEGVLVAGNSVDLDEVALQIIVSSLPIKVVRPGPAKYASGKGYRVISEGEEEEIPSSPFDKLKDLDLDE